jgi:hypothetical protein
VANVKTNTIFHGKIVHFELFWLKMIVLVIHTLILVVLALRSINNFDILCAILVFLNYHPDSRNSWRVIMLDWQRKKMSMMHIFCWIIKVFPLVPRRTNSIATDKLSTVVSCNIIKIGHLPHFIKFTLL